MPKPETKYDSLRRVATRIANKTCVTINKAAAAETECPEMPYKAQFVLEEVIRILQERV